MATYESRTVRRFSRREYASAWVVQEGMSR